MAKMVVIRETLEHSTFSSTGQELEAWGLLSWLGPSNCTEPLSLPYRRRSDILVETQLECIADIAITKGTLRFDMVIMKLKLARRATRNKIIIRGSNSFLNALRCT